jgi:hypothetical protein
MAFKILSARNKEYRNNGEIKKILEFEISDEYGRNTLRLIIDESHTEKISFGIYTLHGLLLSMAELESNNTGNFFNGGINQKIAGIKLDYLVRVNDAYLNSKLMLRGLSNRERKRQFKRVKFQPEYFKGADLIGLQYPESVYSLIELLRNNSLTQIAKADIPPIYYRILSI